jgi:hypothetical protein
MRLDATELNQLLRLVDETRGEEIDCEELLHRVGKYIETHSGKAPPQDFDDILRHLKQCSECFEEVEALLAAFGDGE